MWTQKQFTKHNDGITEEILYISQLFSMTDCDLIVIEASFMFVSP